MENNEFSPLDNDESVKQNGQPLPKLYSEAAIMGFAFFCSTLFASFLTVTNLKSANAKKGIVPVIAFTIMFTALEGFVVGSLLPIKYRMFALLFNLAGGVILNLFFWRKYIPGDLAFEIKPVTKPLLIAFALVMAFLLLSGLGGVAPK